MAKSIRRILESFQIICTFLQLSEVDFMMIVILRDPLWGFKSADPMPWTRIKWERNNHFVSSHKVDSVLTHMHEYLFYARLSNKVKSVKSIHEYFHKRVDLRTDQSQMKLESFWNITMLHSTYIGIHEFLNWSSFERITVFKILLL